MKIERVSGRVVERQRCRAYNLDTLYVEKTTVSNPIDH